MAMAMAMAVAACERVPPSRAVIAGDREPRSAPASCPVLAPRPPRTQPPDPAPLATSSITVQLPIALAQIQPELDKLIPSLSDPSWPRTHKIAEGVCGTWYFDRRPIRLTMDGARLRLAIPGDFGMIAHPHLGPLGCVKPVVSCGDKTAGAAPIPAQLNLSAALAITSDYRVSAALANHGTTFQQPCKLLGGLDTTSVVTSVIDDQIASQLAALDASIASKADLRSEVEAAWSAIQRPHKVSDDLWLVIRPSALTGQVTSSDPNTISVHVAAQAAIALVAQPAAPVTTAIPLPALTAGASDVAPGVHIGVAGSIGYDALTRQLRTQLAGATDDIEYPAGSRHQVTIRDIQVTGPVKCKTNPDGDKCVSLAVEFTGDVCGVVYLVGRPVIDSRSQEIAFQDFEFSLTTSDAVVNTAAWLAHGSLRDRLKRAARVSLASVAAEARRRTSQALQTRRAGGWRLAGTADTVTLRVSTGAGGLDYAVDLSGTLAISVAAP